MAQTTSLNSSLQNTSYNLELKNIVIVYKFLMTWKLSAAGLIKRQHVMHSHCDIYWMRCIDTSHILIVLLVTIFTGNRTPSLTNFLKRQRLGHATSGCSRSSGEVNSSSTTTVHIWTRQIRLNRSLKSFDNWQFYFCLYLLCLYIISTCSQEYSLCRVTNFEVYL